MEETARYLNVNDERRIMVDSPHDVMLGLRWRNGANAVLKWLENDVCAGLSIGKAQ